MIHFLTAYNNTDATTPTTRSIKAKVGDYYFVAPSYAGAGCASEANANQEAATRVDIVKAVSGMVAK